MKKKELLDLYETMLTHGSNNELEILGSKECGCLACGKVFSAREVRDWSNDGLKGMCGICPLCGSVKIIGDSAGFALHDKNFPAAVSAFMSENKMVFDIVAITFCHLYGNGSIGRNERTESIYFDYLNRYRHPTTAIPEFQYALAELFIEGGLTVEPNLDEAISILRSPNLRCDHASLLLLGKAYRYRHGKGDAKASYESFVKASALGSIEALGEIGEMYYHGEYVKRDTQFALASISYCVDALYSDFFLGRVNLFEAARFVTEIADGNYYDDGNGIDDDLICCNYLLAMALLKEYKRPFPIHHDAELFDYVKQKLTDYYGDDAGEREVIFDSDTFFDSFWYHHDSVNDKTIFEPLLDGDVLTFGIDSETPQIIIDKANGAFVIADVVNWTFYGVERIERGPSLRFQDIRFGDDESISFLDFTNDSRGEVSLKIIFIPQEEG